MFNPVAYENSRPDGVAVLEIATPTESRDDQPRQFVPLKRTELTGEIVGPLASLRVTHVYGYSRDQLDKVLEALYRFPLPGDAAVTGVQVHFGNVEIRAELKEREQAEDDYEKAKREGRQAALATREAPDVFTLQVAGIEPDQDVTIETSYVQLARAEGDAWSLRMPLTTAPRYVRSDEATSRHAHGQPLLLLRDPGHRFSLNVNVRGAESVESNTHQLKVTEESDGVRVRLRDGEVVPDRDCVLSWRPQQSKDRPALHVQLHDDRASGQVYFLALIAPPSVYKPGHGVPREVILLVDHSGSMRGAKWEAADWAVERFVSDLTERDTFALGLFHSTTRWFSKEPQQATADALDEAVRFVEKHKDSGGTELGVALEQALDMKRPGDERARHILIVTDAQVSDFGRLLRLADQEAKRKERRRTSVLCIDAAPNSFLASELAERGGGVSRFLTSAPEEQDITTALDEVLADWAEPALADLRLGVNRLDVQVAGRQVMETDKAGRSLVDLGDLPSGRTVSVVGRAPRADSANLSLRVTTAGNQEIAACDLNLTEEVSESPALKALFGARRIIGLEFLINSGYVGEDLRDQLLRLGYDPDEILTDESRKPPRVYAETVRADAQEALRGLLVREALDYGLASSETAFVATRTEAGKPIDGTVAVANALPAGWSDDFLLSPASLAFTRKAGPPLAQALHTGPPVAMDLPLARPFFAGDEAESPDDAKALAEPTPLFSGVPEFKESRAVLFDSSREQDADKLPESAKIHRLLVRFPEGAPDHKDLDRALSLLIFVGDLSSPHARVRLTDLVRGRGERPLNLLKRPGQVVRIVLLDPAETWTHGAPLIEVAFRWQTFRGAA